MILGIYGTGGSGKEVFEMIECNECLKLRWTEVVFIDDMKAAGTFWGCKMLSFEAFAKDYKKGDVEIVIAIGEPKDRERLALQIKQAGYDLATIVHPLAYVSPSAKLGDGVVLKASVIVSSEAEIQNNVYVNANTIIGHNVVIGANSQIASFVAVMGATRIGENAYIGASAAIRERLSIGNDVIISMGAVVMKDVRADKIVMGNPAREIANNTDQKVFK